MISHFFYCFIVWMFHSRRLNISVNNIQELLELLAKDISSSIHHRHVSKLVTKMFKLKIGIAL